MVDDRPQADRILIAQLTGEARHRAQWRELTTAEESAAVAELRDLAGGRADLLAEVCGPARRSASRDTSWRTSDAGSGMTTFLHERRRSL